MSIKYELNATQNQIDKLLKALHVGSPINVALSVAGIQMTTFIWWQEIASVVDYCRNIEFIQNMRKQNGSSIDIDDLKEQLKMNQQNSFSSMYSIKAYKEPSGKAILKYKNSKSYKEFADKVYDIINQCSQMQSEIVMYHLSAIRDASRNKGGNAQSSQWFLEKTLPNVYGRNAEQYALEQQAKGVAKVKVEFVDPNTQENVDRVKDMENLILSQLGSDGTA